MKVMRGFFYIIENVFYFIIWIILCEVKGESMWIGKWENRLL